MTLIKISNLLKASQNEDYLIGCIECWNYESAIAIISAAEEVNCPVVLFTGEPAIKLLGMRNLARMILDLAVYSKIPVACHIEAVNDHTILFEAIKYGFPSVIYDGSELPIEQNIRNTKELVQVAHAVGVEVEAQIGSMPLSETGTGYEKIDFSKHKTRIDEAEFFVQQTKIDILAPNLGNVHGLYKEKIKTLDLDLANALVDRIGLPITLHGGTGIPDEILSEAKKSKLSMVYFATSIFENFRSCLKSSIDTKSGYGSVSDIECECRDNLKSYVEERLIFLESRKYFNPYSKLENLQLEKITKIITDEILKSIK